MHIPLDECIKSTQWWDSSKHIDLLVDCFDVQRI